ncbi:MAG: DUF3570 domain-containing protein [Burkholderiales bacterium]|nr:DUF3570 domain-containing protein [Burkholderiales bacterium]
MLAALALPGLATTSTALADSAPEKASLAVKYLDYRDSQPGADRIHVTSPALELVLPIAGNWSLQANTVSDSISGASPRYHSAISSASHFDEQRRATDVSVTRYFSRGSVNLGAGRSGENDYVSRYYSAQATLATEDNNTTFLFGTSFANDDINPVNKIVKNERKHSNEFMFGITQVMSPVDLAQIVLTHIRGRGYFSDPYKSLDRRPRERDENIMLLRWNHHFTSNGNTLRLSYRYYSNSYGVNSHSVEKEYVVPFGDGWKFTPSARFYTQSAAGFYYDPVYDTRFKAPFPVGYKFGSTDDISADHRLSAFGALTLGFKLEKQITADWSADLKLEMYQQRGSWRLLGTGSPGLANFSARSVQLGLKKTW